MHLLTKRATAALAALSLLPAWAPAHAAEDVPADRLARSVLHIRTAAYDKDGKYWKNVGYGSAVYVGGGAAVTNAHVVADEEGAPTGAHMACWSADWRKAPDTCVPALLTLFDAERDLAVLALDFDLAPSAELPLAAAWPQNAAEIGDSVRMVGYPRNGGETVTVTEGKISGQEDGTGLLKVDANVDAGNSGGGLFAADGTLLGITSAASVGYSTLGVAIPAADARDAVARAAKDRKPLEQEAFVKYFEHVSAVGAMRRTGTIDNALLRLRKFSSFGFALESAVTTDDGSAGHYRFGDRAAHDTHVSVWAASGGGKPQAWLYPYLKESMAAGFERSAGARGAKIGGSLRADVVVGAGPRAAGQDPDVVMVAGSSADGKFGFSVVGTRKNAGAFRRALSMVGVALRKDSPDWAEIRPVENFRASLPAGWTYRVNMKDQGTLVRSFNATVGGARVMGELETLTMPAKSFPDAAAYLKTLVDGLEDRLGASPSWAGVLDKTANGVPFLRMAYEAGGSRVQASVFVWEESPGTLRVVIAAFEAPDAAAARAAADAFAAATTLSKPFGLPMGSAKIGADVSR